MTPAADASRAMEPVKSGSDWRVTAAMAAAMFFAVAALMACVKAAEAQAEIERLKNRPSRACEWRAA